MRPIKFLLILTMIISLIAFSGCTGNDSEVDTIDTVDTNEGIEDQPPMPPEVKPNLSDNDNFIYGTAIVEDIEILTLESFPVQIHVIAKGYLPDGCTEIGEITNVRDGNTFTITIETIRPADAMCTQAIVPYEKSIPLDVYGLKAGTYTVFVNSVSESFELAMDNSITD